MFYTCIAIVLYHNDEAAPVSLVRCLETNLKTNLDIRCTGTFSNPNRHRRGKWMAMTINGSRSSRNLYMDRHGERRREIKEFAKSNKMYMDPMTQVSQPKLAIEKCFIIALQLYHKNEAAPAQPLLRYGAPMCFQIPRDMAWLFICTYCLIIWSRGSFGNRKINFQQPWLPIWC